MDYSNNPIYESHGTDLSRDAFDGTIAHQQLIGKCPTKQMLVAKRFSITLVSPIPGWTIVNLV